LLPPDGIIPVSHDPASLVDVCGILSVFFQVTVDIFAIVMEAGLNAILAIMTVFGSVLLGGGGVDELYVGLVELLLHPNP
jgi:hypothetical protein